VIGTLALHVYRGVNAQGLMVPAGFSQDFADSASRGFFP
jgi:hypothetical protein